MFLHTLQFKGLAQKFLRDFFVSSPVFLTLFGLPFLVRAKVSQPPQVHVHLSVQGGAFGPCSSSRCCISFPPTPSCGTRDSASPGSPSQVVFVHSSPLAAASFPAPPFLRGCFNLPLLCKCALSTVPSAPGHPFPPPAFLLLGGGSHVF